MKRIGLAISLALLITAQAGLAMAYGEAVFSRPIYATQAGTSYYTVTDQTIKLWGDDGTGNPVEAETRDNDGVIVIQGADQNWGGTGNIMPGLINYGNFLGTPDYVAAGFGGAASGGSLVVAFDQDIVNGNGIDFMVHGFGFCFNQAFSAERGTVRIYAATADYNPTISAADPDGPGPLGEVTITGDESQWVLLSEWKGWGDWDNDPDTPDTWEGNPDMNYGSSPGAYGQFLWGDLSDGGLETARYLKFVLGDGGHYIDPYTGENNNGRAFFIDAVEARGYEAPANQPPVLQPIGNKEVDEGMELSFTLQAEDPEGDGLTFSYIDEPEMAGATLDPNTGVFAWTPPDGADGIYTVMFTVADDGSPSASDQETIEITVGNVNHPPVFDDNAPASTYAALEGQTISFAVSATDPDGDTVSYGLTGLPGDAVFSNGVFTWATDFEDAGSYTLTFTATDDGSPSETTTQTVTLTVGAVNRAPVFNINAPAATYTANEGETITFSVSATDPDGDTVSYGVTGLPDGAIFSGGSFSWSTGSGDAGTYNLTFTATDSGTPAKSATQDVILTVAAGSENQAPVFDAGAPAASYMAQENETISFSVSAADPEGNGISFCITGLPSGAGFLNGVFTWTTDFGDAGIYTLEFTATDDGSPSKSATKSVTLTVVAGFSQHAGPDQVVIEQTSVTLGVSAAADACNAYDCDLNNDGTIDQSDFMIFRESWGTPDALADFNEDGIVNTSDFIIFRSCCEAGNQDEQSMGTYQWVQTSGPEVTLSDAAVAAPTFIAPQVDAGEEVVLTFRATLNSNVTDDVRITVQDNGIQLTEKESQLLENADLVFDNSIGADINAQDHCHMGLTGDAGELTFYEVLDPADTATGEATPENLIYGLFEFELSLPPGTQTAVWSVFLPEPASEDYRWYKYNAVTGEWIDFSRDLISGGTGDGAEFNADRTRVTLYVTDGGDYDDDGIVNQQVSDPSGLGTASTGGGSGGGEGGGGGGCFIGSLVK